MHIAPNQVHIWQSHRTFSSNETVYNEQINLLDHEEKRRALRFHFPIHRNRFIHVHATLRTILSDYLQCNAKDIRFGKAAHGKPFIETPRTSLAFNLSHTEEEVVCAIHADSPLGIDIETMKKREEESMAARFFAESEYTALMQCKPSQRMAAFYALWVGKEAILKAAGLGLHASLKDVVIQLNKANQFVAFENKVWQLMLRDVLPHYKLALACSQEVTQLVYYTHAEETAVITKIEQLRNDTERKNT